MEYGQWLDPGMMVEQREIKRSLASFPDRTGTVTGDWLLEHFARNYSYCKATNIGRFLTQILFVRTQHFEVLLLETKKKKLAKTQ